MPAYGAEKGAHCVVVPSPCNPELAKADSKEGRILYGPVVDVRGRAKRGLVHPHPREATRSQYTLNKGG